ncbi:MAG: GTP-binding protein [Candidatus Hodarchaeales archaeon]|jgi:Rab family protein
MRDVLGFLITQYNAEEDLIVRMLKLVLLGDDQVGKTTLVKAFMGGEITGTYKATIGIDIGRKTISLSGEEVLFQLWDLSGQESFKKIRRNFYSGTSGAVAVYDISRLRTYESILNWIEELTEIAGRVPVVLVGNKVDLRETGEGTITHEDGQNMAERVSQFTLLETPFTEASAIRRENSDEPFFRLGNLIKNKLDPGFEIQTLRSES